MPTMKATNTPHAAATMRSRRLAPAFTWSRAPTDALSPLPVAPPPKASPPDVMLYPLPHLQRPVQDAGTEFDDGDHVEQQHQRRERERNCDVAGAAAALLLFGEDDAALTFAIVMFVVVVGHAGVQFLTA